MTGLEGMCQERKTGVERAMAGQWGLRGNKKPLFFFGGWGERRAAPEEAARDGLILVTDACFTPHWSEIRISYLDFPQIIN